MFLLFRNLSFSFVCFLCQLFAAFKQPLINIVISGYFRPELGLADSMGYQVSAPNPPLAGSTSGFFHSIFVVNL